jgi:uncharacterized protein (DUF433 family)
MEIESKIVRVPNICFGRAHVEGKRFPVWMVILYHRNGFSDVAILDVFPDLTQTDLDAVWDYYRSNPLEIDRDVWYQDVAGSLDPASPVPWQAIAEGIRLGLDNAALRDSFEQALTDEQIADAWNSYRKALATRVPANVPLSRVA